MWGRAQLIQLTSKNVEQAMRWLTCHPCLPSRYRLAHEQTTHIAMRTMTTLKTRALMGRCFFLNHNNHL